MSKCTSAQVQNEDIAKLKQEVNEPHPEQVDILVNAGYVVQERGDTYVSPFYKRHPPLHLLGSRVINLNATV